MHGILQQRREGKISFKSIKLHLIQNQVVFEVSFGQQCGWLLWTSAVFLVNHKHLGRKVSDEVQFKHQSCRASLSELHPYYSVTVKPLGCSMHEQFQRFSQGLNICKCQSRSFSRGIFCVDFPPSFPFPPLLCVCVCVCLFTNMSL